ncbi:proacrosin [Culex quinquefasciatus]|uniref:Proacrosin n=1 Tax=Culex quinquefasciatus TaxID=7176 RepID=B0W281_CULQU|nr:proacrosin [Culex quinquefasciatus]|eukprot:XP_001842780.1 proacrosin [Culex quinquefasciatus]
MACAEKYFDASLLSWLHRNSSFAKSCGLQKIKTRELITSGYNTYPGQFPWHVALFHKKSRTVTEYACGGSLISRSYVLTAAHCTKSEDNYVINPRRLIVSMGSHNRRLAGPNVQQHSVYEIHSVTSEGEWAGLRNDIALLELTSSVGYSDYIQPICLNSLEVSGRDSGMVVGWGRTEDGDLPEMLKAASMPIISHIDCLASDRDVYGGVLDSGMICAGHQNGTSVCNGDSGGGLVIQRCTLGACYWSLVGIVSIAAGNFDGSCRSDGYGAFTNVKTYLPWIKQTTVQIFEDDSLLHIAVDYCRFRSFVSLFVSSNPATTQSPRMSTLWTSPESQVDA